MCGGTVGVEAVRVQYQADLPPVWPHVTAFHVHVGRCRRWGRRPGRDGRQTSTATGAAASQVGPRALAWGSVAAHGPGRAVREGRDDPARGLRACDHARRARYAGVLVRDGWAPYRKLPHATRTKPASRAMPTSGLCRLGPG